MILPKIKRGFTLIEILLVIAILSILLVVVFAALNPAQRLQDTRNARRWNDVNQMLTAVHECLVDNDGNMNACISYDIADGDTLEMVNEGVSTGCNAVCTSLGATDCVEIENELITTGAYLASLPTDPSGVVTDHTGYQIASSSGIITITACGAEGGDSISVSR